MDSPLIPPDPASWYVWDQQTTVLNRERIGEDGMSPILPFQPVCCFCHAHEMGRDLRIKVRGHRNAGSTSYRRCTQPARHAPDAHQVGHDEVPGPRDDRLIQYARAVVVLPELNGRPQLASELDVTRKVVVDNRLLEPEEALIIEGVAALQGVTQPQPLIEITHQLDSLAHRFTDGRNGRQIIGEAVPA